MKIKEHKKDFSNLWRILLTLMIQVMLLGAFYFIVPMLKSLKMYTGAMISYTSISILLTLIVFTLIKPKKEEILQPAVNNDSVILNPNVMPYNPTPVMNDIPASSYDATVYMGKTEFVMPQTEPEKPRELINVAYLVAGNGTGSKVEINVPEFVIGRQADEVNYHIDNSHISRKHTVIIRNNNQFYLKDLESKNKTYLNGFEILPQQAFKLSHGDEIKVFDIPFKFEIHQM